MKWTVSIVEDNATFRQAVAAIVQQTEELLLGPVYATGEEALKLTEAPVDVCLMDIQLPGIDGLELLRRLKPLTPKTEYLVCSIHDDDSNIMQALENGASGYILKDSSTEQIRSALIDVAQGRAPMSPFVARRVISFFQAPKLSDAAVLLTEREQEVIRLMAKGMQYKEIAAQLQVSVETVKKHIHNTYKKLHVQNKVEAIRRIRFL